ncbi:Putative transport protein [Klebsiella pneumoniae IS53]|uniref:Transport protein n=1 Tax=Klebsiella pneumoniae IS43 TaxID=1432552 RepID=W1DHJ5_KLEPN|nr:Putative transport protein [Klebsiella pneumoniae IS43]CDL22306.1 Putative transport protein [Klebsiella pneumoniae IS53]
MTRFLLCSFALVLLYPSGIDMYLVGLPRIAQDLGASEAQLHIAFSVYLAGMASAMLFAGRIADRSGRKPVAIVGAAIFVIASLLCAQAHTSSHFLIGRFIQGIAPAAATWWLSLSCAIRWTTVAAPRCCRCSTASPALSPSWRRCLAT